MRFAMATAAAGALWVQPAQAAAIFNVVGDGALTERPGCIIGQISPACMAAPSVTTGQFSITGVVNEAFVFGNSISFGVRMPLSGCPFEDCMFSGAQGGSFRLDSFSRMGQPDRSLSIVGTNFQFTLGPDSPSPINIVVGAVTPVPEPTTWALMLAGFGVIGWSMRRGKAAAAQVVKVRQRTALYSVARAQV